MEKLFKLQQKIGVISKTETNPFFKSKYFDINGLLRELTPLLEEYKLLLLQPLTTINDKPAIRTKIIDTENKEVLLDDYIVLPDLQDPQKMGSAITYYRRYSLQSALGLQAEDDDGNMASQPQKTNTISKMETGLKKAVNIETMKKDIALFLDTNCPVKPKTKEDYENACIDMFGIELKPDNYKTILDIINNK